MAPVPTQRTLVLGGARSGKSALAERLCRASGLTKIYVATAGVHDAEMAARIHAHQEMRASDGWRTIEEQHELAATLAQTLDPKHVVLVDCLTLWLSNRLLTDANAEAAFPSLLQVIRDASGPIVLVSNETGLGIVPDNALARTFRDLQGKLNQQVAAVADTVVFVAAGCPLTLKGSI